MCAGVSVPGRVLAWLCRCDCARAARSLSRSSGGIVCWGFVLWVTAGWSLGNLMVLAGFGFSPVGLR